MPSNITPEISNLLNKENGVALEARVKQGAVYRLEKTPDLLSGKWAGVGHSVTAESYTVTFFDPAGTNTSQQFYRIIEEQGN